MCVFVCVCVGGGGGQRLDGGGKFMIGRFPKSSPLGKILSRRLVCLQVLML